MKILFKKFSFWFFKKRNIFFICRYLPENLTYVYIFVELIIIYFCLFLTNVINYWINETKTFNYPINDNYLN